MKRISFTLLISIVTCSIRYSQNGSQLNSSEDIQTKEIKINNVEAQTSSIESIQKSELSFVSHEEKESLVQHTNNKETVSYQLPFDSSLYRQGRKDATKNYDGYKTAGTGTFVVSLISPIVGLIPAIACSSTKPKDFNLGYTNPELMKNADYQKGYTQNAKKIKQGRVWRNWAIAFSINLVLAIAIAS